MFDVDVLDDDDELELLKVFADNIRKESTLGANPTLAF